MAAWFEKAKTKLTYAEFRLISDDLCESVCNHNKGTQPSHVHWESATKRVDVPVHLLPRHMKRGRNQQFLFQELVSSFYLSFCGCAAAYAVNLETGQELAWSGDHSAKDKTAQDVDM